MQRLLDDIRTRQDVPGVSAVVTQRDTVVFAGGSGLADIGSGRKMTTDTLLYAGSLTKILTAILALNLVEEGDLALDEVVLKTGVESSEITLSHLLTHSSGLVREGNFGYWFTAEFPDGDGLSRFLQETELRSPPGGSVHYSNIGYAALGQVLEQRSATSYSRLLKTRVLDPTGMSSSGSPGPVTGISAGYTPTGRVIPSETRPFAGVGQEVGGRHLREYHDARAMTPAFGVYSTANDLGRLMQFLLGFGNREIISDELRQQMLNPQSSRRSYGLGTGVIDGRKIARHGGWFAAHRSHILIDLEAEIGVVVLANSDSADPEAISKALQLETLNSSRRSD
jgi:CubicO group peptidase (beta-lactamase class C family)